MVYKANKLTLNASMTKYIDIILRKKEQSVNFDYLKLFIDDEAIEREGIL